MLIQIEGPKFTCGIEFMIERKGPTAVKTLCIHAPPMITYMLGWTIGAMADYCDMKGWRWKPIRENSEELD